MIKIKSNLFPKAYINEHLHFYAYSHKNFLSVSTQETLEILTNKYKW